MYGRRSWKWESRPFVFIFTWLSLYLVSYCHLPSSLDVNFGNLLSPLSFNLFFLIFSTYCLVFHSGSDTLQKWRYFSWIFIGFNGSLFPFHLLVGLNWLGLRKSTNFPPIISMDPTYVWIPIVSYLFFFFLGLSILLLVIRIEKRRRRRKWNERLRNEWKRKSRHRKNQKNTIN